MLRDKVIKVFDLNVIKEGNLITVEYYSHGDEGELELLGCLNGIVIETTEARISFRGIDGEIYDVFVSEIERGRKLVKGNITRFE